MFNYFHLKLTVDGVPGVPGLGVRQLAVVAHVTEAGRVMIQSKLSGDNLVLDLLMIQKAAVQTLAR